MAQDAFHRDALGYWVEQAPNSQVDWTLDWIDELGIDSILTSAWVVQAGLILLQHSNTATTTTIWINIPIGTAIGAYAVTNNITSVNNPPRIMPRSFRVVVRATL